MTIQKNLGHSPRKLRVVAAMVRGLKPEAAVATLRYVNRAAAIDLAKAIKTALANSGNRTDLIFKALEINEGMRMRRYRVGTAGRGRGRPYRKLTSHIRVILTDEIAAEPVIEAKPAKAPVETKAKKEVKSEVKKGETSDKE